MDTACGSRLLLMAMVLLLVDQRLVVGYAAGPPVSTCLTMFPKHEGRHEQKSESPFHIRPSSNSYTTGQRITIDIYSDDYDEFRGLMVRVQRVSGDTEDIVGAFSNAEPEGKFLYIDCFGAKQSMVGHQNNDNITNASMVWTAPSKSVGDVVITVTVVEDFYTWWYGLKYTLKGPSPERDPMLLPDSSDFEAISWYACGSQKGCFLYPTTCSGDDCKAAVAFKKCGEGYKFEMMYDGDGYISLGLSDDRMMGDDEAFVCTAKNSKMSIQHAYNPFQFTERNYALRTYRSMKMKYIDGKIMCQFIRPASLTWYSMTMHKNITRNFDEETYHMFLAWGPVKGDDVVDHHINLPPISNSKVSLGDYSIVRGSSLHLLIRIHAVLFVIGWVFFAGITIIISRFYKDALPVKTICKIGAWFQVHRAVAFLVWATSASGFIIIFVHLDGLTENDDVKAHAYIGIAVMAAVTLQAIAGIARPDKDSKIRPAFNWGHLFLGTAAHILAAANIILAFQMPMITSEQREFGTIVFVVWIGVQIIWELIFRVMTCRDKESDAEIFDTGTTGKFSIQEEKKEQKSSAKTVMLVLYIISMTALTIAGALSIFFF